METNMKNEKNYTTKMPQLWYNVPVMQTEHPAS